MEHSSSDIVRFEWNCFEISICKHFPLWIEFLSRTCTWYIERSPIKYQGCPSIKVLDHRSGVLDHSIFNVTNYLFLFILRFCLKREIIMNDVVCAVRFYHGDCDDEFLSGLFESLLLMSYIEVASLVGIGTFTFYTMRFNVNIFITFLLLVANLA